MIKPASKLTQVGPGLFGWAAFHTGWKVDFNSYALQTSAGLVLLDPTQPAAAVVKKLEGLGTPAAIILTNAHHDRAADWFRKRYAIQIYANEHAQADCDTKIDVFVVEGEKLPGGLKTIFLPGVTTSEMALVAQNGDGILFIGDAVLNTPGKGLELLPDQFIEDRREARRSLRKVLDYDFQVVTFGHGAPLVSQAKAELTRFLKAR